MYDLIVIGGGAAGVFAAITAKKNHSSSKVILLEKTGVPLAKVRVSGGGRCNVTHACFDPIELSKNYPRGGKELIGLFHRFQPRDVIEWFKSKGVFLKTESDGRIFPITDRSETIIQCLLSGAHTLGVELHLRQQIETISHQDCFTVQLKEKECLNPSKEIVTSEQQVYIQGKNLLLATGSSSMGYSWAQSLGHTIQAPVPSLFTFNIPTSPLKNLSGITLAKVRIQIKGTSFNQTGPLLLTHFGFSGPAVLKLSAWAARHLNEKQYCFDLLVDWLPDHSEDHVFERLTQLKKSAPQKNLASENLFSLPKNLWKSIVEPEFSKRLGEISFKELRLLAKKLHENLYRVEGKTTHKEEFVTCGGVSLKEIDFKKMESKICSRLFFAGEILDIDGVTGGFNFQNAWSTGYLVGKSIYTET